MAIEQTRHGPVKGAYRFALLDLLLQLGQCVRRQILAKDIPMVNRRLFSGIANTKQFLDLIIEALVILLLGNELFQIDRKSTRLNSSHVAISYAVFCLKK